jgi:hypothetical protein
MLKKLKLFVQIKKISIMEILILVFIILFMAGGYFLTSKIKSIRMKLFVSSMASLILLGMIWLGPEGGSHWLVKVALTIFLAYILVKNFMAARLLLQKG